MVVYFRSEFVEEIVNHGLITFLSFEPMNEDVSTPRTPPDVVVTMMVRYLEKIGVDNELIVIDPYFFAPRVDSTYPATLVNILTPFASKLKDLRIVTASHQNAYSAGTRQVVEEALGRSFPSLRVHHTTSNEIHDRFWISNGRTKGILTGTSLNGLGRKYTIMDYLQDADVATLVNEFSASNII